MKLADAYSEVIKYAVLKHEAIKPFLDSHFSDVTASYTNPTHSPASSKTATGLQGMTDKMLEAEDPRGYVWQRHMNLTSHPDPHYQITDKQYPTAFRKGSLSVGLNDNNSNMTFEPVAKSPLAKADAVRVFVDHSSHGIGSHAFFTPEEARELVNIMHPSDAKNVHSFLDQHFPNTKPKSGITVAGVAKAVIPLALGHLL
jgi:hypothetical protein